MVSQALVPAKKFAAVDRCIYCGATGDALTNEHIIPFFLGGRLVLPRASCRDCEKITKKFEGKCARKMLGKFSIRTGLPTQNPKKRPATLPIEELDASGLGREKQIPVIDYPRFLMMPVFPLPSLIAMHNDRTDGYAWVSMNKADFLKVRSTHAKSGRAKLDIPVQEFMRMLAKIGHAFAAAELGSEFFSKWTPLLCDYIKAGIGDVRDFVGNDRGKLSSTNLLNNVTLHTAANNNFEYLVASVRIFGNLDAPQYLVVVAQRP